MYNEQASVLRELDKSGVRIPAMWIRDAEGERRLLYDQMKQQLEEVRAKYDVLLKSVGESDGETCAQCGQETAKESADGHSFCDEACRQLWSGVKKEETTHPSTTVFNPDGTFKSHSEMTRIAAVIEAQWTNVKQWLDCRFGSLPLVWEGSMLYGQVIQRLADAHIVLKVEETRAEQYYYKFVFVPVQSC